MRASFRSFALRHALLACLLIFVAACATTSQTETDEPEDTTVSGSEFDDGTGAEDTAASNAARLGLGLATVYFDFDKSVIREDARRILNDAATSLVEAGLSVTIEGHTDFIGSEEYNLALGERRAAAVRRYLYNAGVPNDRMSIVSYGEARPAVQGTSDKIRELNRRAEVKPQ